MTDEDKALVDALLAIAGAFGSAHPASITQQQAANRIEAQAAEIERLGSVIDATALHWLALQDKHQVPWEGAIDGAMAAACAEIEKLREALKPFAKAGEIAGEPSPYGDWYAYRPAAGDEYAIFGQHLRDARAALGETK